MIFDQKTQEFYVKKGPLFAQIILADEINRAPAKVQAALLEAMQEHQVTIGGTTFTLEEPFLVLATQNPIENEGTYPLPEAQLDRFMLKVQVGYPSRGRGEGGPAPHEQRPAEIPVERLLEPGGDPRRRGRSPSCTWTRRLVDYIVDLVRATREPATVGLHRPQAAHRVRRVAARLDRAGAGRARARVPPRAAPTSMPEDVQALAPDVLRHRIVLTFEAEAEDTTTRRRGQRGPGRGEGALTAA